MSRWMYPCVLILSFLIGACTPESNNEYANEALETRPNDRLTLFVDNGLEAANRGLMELEQEAGEAATEADTMLSQTVAKLRSDYQELSEEADSLFASTDSTDQLDRVELRDKLVNLTRTVEKTRFEIIDESDEYREVVTRRLSELDQRMYELTSDINEAGLTREFDAMITRLNILREEAASQVTQLESATNERWAAARNDVTDALATFSARLTEAETEYQTAASEMNDPMSSDKDAHKVEVEGRAAVEPINQ